MRRAGGERGGADAAAVWACGQGVAACRNPHVAQRQTSHGGSSAPSWEEQLAAPSFSIHKPLVPASVAFLSCWLVGLFAAFLVQGRVLQRYFLDVSKTGAGAPAAADSRTVQHPATTAVPHAPAAFSATHAPTRSPGSGIGLLGCRPARNPGTCCLFIRHRLRCFARVLATRFVPECA